MIIGQILFTTLSNRFLGDIGKTNSRFTKQQMDKPSVGDTPLTKRKQRTAVIVILTCFVVFFWLALNKLVAR